MKKLYLYTFLYIVLSLISCKKDIVEDSKNYRALEPLNLDMKAGDWKPFFGGTSADYLLPAPEAVSSVAYQRIKGT